MFKDLPFKDAADLYASVKGSLPLLCELFGAAGCECIVDAMHIYATSGYAEECCGFDLDFCRIFCLAYACETGHELKPEHSCLTNWDGMKWPGSTN